MDVDNSLVAVGWCLVLAEAIHLELVGLTANHTPPRSRTGNSTPILYANRWLRSVRGLGLSVTELIVQMVQYRESHCIYHGIV